MSPKAGFTVYIYIYIYIFIYKYIYIFIYINPTRTRLNWDAITTNQDVASRIDTQISTDWESLERNQTNSYMDYVDICNTAGSDILPPREAFRISVRHMNEVNAVHRL